MAKTKEELEQLKQEYDQLNEKLKQLDDEELKAVVGGVNQASTDGTLRINIDEHNLML